MLMCIKVNYKQYTFTGLKFSKTIIDQKLYFKFFWKGEKL